MTIKINPSYSNAFFNRGNTFRDLGKHKQAEEDYLSAINLQPQHPLYLLTTSKQYITLNNSEKAKEFFERGLDAFSSRTEAFLKREYLLTPGNITFIRESIESFQAQEQELDVLKEISQEQGRDDILKNLARLSSLNEVISIKGAVEEEKHEEESPTKKEENALQQSLMKDMQIMKEEI